MKKHLSEAFIERLRPPKAGYTEVFDLGYPGLAFRVGHGGSKAFRLYYRGAGTVRARALGRWPEVSLAAARDQWRKTRESIAKGEAPRDSKPNGSLFEHVIEEWLSRDMSQRNTANSMKQVERMVDRDLLPAWRGRSVAAITKKDVLELLDATVDRGARVKANRLHAAMRRFFKWCAGRELITANPMNGLERPTKEVSRDRVLSDAELTAVWRGSSGLPIHGAIARLLILTGMRREEATALRWSEVKGDHIELSNGRTKSGAAHIVPLSAAAQELLGNLRRIAGSDFCFSLNGSKAVTGWSLAKKELDKAAGVSDWRLHDLRRTMATGCQKLGVSLQTVESILGHVSGSRAGVIGVYQRHDFLAEKRVALEKWAKHVTKLVG
jgi:integrase